MTAHQWTLADIPDLAGKQAVVTGVTSGIGEKTVLELARAGSRVIMAARNESKLRATVDDLKRTLPSAELVPLVVDLADLSSIRRAADEAAQLGPIDILINNAGVMATPFSRTVDGFELQFGTNHLGHFALTGLLFPQLAAADAARVVTVSSHAHRGARSVPLGDPRHDQRHYRKWTSYAESKLANLLFAFELDRRARAAGTAVTSMGAHPGYAATNLFAHLHAGGVKPVGAIAVGTSRLLGQPAELGALPSLMAATMPGLPGGSYTGPRGLAEMRGKPTLVSPSRTARDEALARKLWDISEEATRIHFP
ncbi:MAG TPA: oxidoreductase [Nocardioidaceae bacterium]|nr:oxidoreductase [Nocardioidaceae bacterium]